MPQPTPIVPQRPPQRTVTPLAPQSVTLSSEPELLTAFEDYRAAEWVWKVCDLSGVPIADVSRLAFDKQITYALNAPAVARCWLPADDPLVNTLHTDGYPYVHASRRTLKCWRKTQGAFVIWFAGIVEQVEDDGDDDRVRTLLTAFGADALLWQRLARNSSGAITETISFTNQRGDLIAKTLVDRTITNAGACAINTGGTMEQTSERTIVLAEGTTVGEALERLTETGTMDVWFEPVDRNDGILAVMHVYADQGAAKPDIKFEYATGGYNVRRWRRILDGRQAANDVRLFYARPATGVDWPVKTATDSTSIAAHYRRESARFFPDWPADNETLVQALADEERDVRRNPRELVNFEPIPERAPVPFTEWFLGDRVTVACGAAARQAVTGTQRIYEFTVSIDNDGFETVSDVKASASAE